LFTWNYYGELTNIESTEEYGYQYFEILKDIVRSSINPEFAYTEGDLAVPLQIYRLRIKHQSDTEVNQDLDRAFDLIVVGDLSAAKAIVAKYPLEP